MGGWVGGWAGGRTYQAVAQALFKEMEDGGATHVVVQGLAELGEHAAFLEGDDVEVVPFG